MTKSSIPRLPHGSSHIPVTLTRFLTLARLVEIVTQDDEPSLRRPILARLVCFLVKQTPTGMQDPASDDRNRDVSSSAASPQVFFSGESLGPGQGSKNPRRKETAVLVD